MPTHGEGAFERDNVPDNKDLRPSTRENSEYKWQTKGCVGALEIQSEPDLDLHETMKPHNAKVAMESAFQEAQAAFEGDLRKSFIEAAEGVPVVTCCFGIIQNDQKTIKQMVPHLNETWVKEANSKLEEKGFKLDCYIWTWSNISGASESTVLMIRFFQLTK